MKKLINYLFKSYIEKKAKELIQDHIKERVSAHDKMVSKAKIDTKVIVINADPEAAFHEMYGITDEKYAKLQKVIGKALKTHKSFPEAIEEISTHCVHPNELAAISYMVGSFSEKQHAMINNPMSGLIGLLEQMKRRNQEED